MKKLILTLVALLTMASGALAQIGSLSADLVFTPITPCRIVDTRGVGGVIAANSSRNFVAWNINYTNQGGDSGDCGMLLTRNVAAVALNLLVISPAADGWIAAYPAGATRPNVSNLNYKAGDVLANSAILKINQNGAVGGGYDFTVYTTSNTHFVADITGYYSKPVVTALECVDTANTIFSVAASGGTGNASAPACAAGYTQTATNCETTSWLMPIVFSHSGTCSARNNDSTAQDIRASRTCCRIPGR